MQRRPESDGAWFGLRERFAHLGLAQGFDELLCLPHLRRRRDLWYQVETVRKVLKQFRGRVLLADEVGLGKTIEAGMVLKEYALRGMAERAAGAHAGLAGRPMARGAGDQIRPRLRDHPRPAAARRPASASGPAIASSPRSPPHGGASTPSACSARSFDLVIVDEAHHLRDRSSQSWKLVDALNKRFLLLLSATPVQNDLIELYNLLTLLKPGIFKTLKEFRAAYMTPGKPRQPANPERLRELMRGAMIRNTRAVVALQAAAPARHDHQGRRRAGASGGLRRARAGWRARLARRTAASATGWRCSICSARPAHRRPPRPRRSHRFADRHRRRRRAGPRSRERWARHRVGGKEAALIDLLRRNPDGEEAGLRPFTRDARHLADLLERAGHRLRAFDGSLSGPRQGRGDRRLPGPCPVLLCTQSGGEGRNIQFCNTLINFDVPWNPMAIEQRIGRIDRIGQKREVFVFNLVTARHPGGASAALLDEKISMFELVVGEVGAILGGLEEEREFPDLVLDAWLGATEAGRVQAFDALGQRLEEARQQHEDAKALDEKLFGEDFETA